MTPLEEYQPARDAGSEARADGLMTAVKSAQSLAHAMSFALSSPISSRRKFVADQAQIDSSWQ
jgi:hypothetical protein